MQFAALFSLIASVIGPLAFRLLAMLGIGAISMTGIDLMLDSVESYIRMSLSSTGTDVAMILGLAKVDVAINIMLAAVVTRATIAGMNKASGSFKKLGSLGKGA